jgi:hypothetical protein
VLNFIMLKSFRANSMVLRSTQDLDSTVFKVNVIRFSMHQNASEEMFFEDQERVCLLVQSTC